MKRLLLIALLTGGCGSAKTPTPTARYPACPAALVPIDVPMFHGDRARSGWNSTEPTLTPTSVAASFGWLWDSEPLDADAGHAARIHASPLYFDSIGPQPFVVTATSNAWVYAVAACSGAERAGTILWRTRLSTPLFEPHLDGGLPLGVLSTPVADLGASPPRLYVTSLDATAGWQLFALDLATGTVLPGWPLTFSPASVGAANKNGPALFAGPTLMAQRGALALSPAGDIVYVDFGSFTDSAPGWLVAVDTRTVEISASFAAAQSSDTTAAGGLWAASGPAIDAAGGVWATSGNAQPGPTAGSWGESLLAWSPRLDLVGTYTPWNHCQLDRADIDVGADGPLLLPDLTPVGATARHLVAFGSKQGNVYLVDRNALPGGLHARPACSTDPTTDGSLLPPGPQPQFGARGPLGVFGPYSEQYGNSDSSRMRTTPAWFDDGMGGHFLFVAGSSKTTASSTEAAPPGVARLRVAASVDGAFYLTVDAEDHVLAFANPGSPVVVSEGGSAPVVFVLDQNSSRKAPTLGKIAGPILYAVDGTTLEPLYQSPPGRVGIGGKYASPTVAHGWVFVATDRLQAFGIEP